MRKQIQLIAGATTGFAGTLGVRSYLQFQQDRETAEKRVANEKKIARTQVGDIVYGTRGAGPPVLVIHGAGGGFDQALHFAQIFGSSFQWITPSRFGYLGTPLPQDASPAAQADAHAALLDALKIERLPVIGISAGGTSALQFALRHPERCTGLVMVSAVSKAMIPVASNPKVMRNLANSALAFEWIIWLGLQAAIKNIVPPLGVSKRVMQSLDTQDLAWMQTLLEHVLPIRARCAGLVNDYTQILQLDIFPLDQIKSPTLVIHAKDDSMVPLKQGRFSAQNIPGAQFVELPSGGHWLLGQSERVQAEVKPFLQEITNGC